MTTEWKILIVLGVATLFPKPDSLMFAAWIFAALNTSDSLDNNNINI